MHKITCSIDGCGGKMKGHGLCEKHRYRYKKYGDPLAGGTFWGEPKAFMESMEDSDDCIEWPYNRNNMGYAMISLGGVGKLVHRVSCEISHGPPPSPSHEAAHLCGNGHKGCVNPKHLAWKTRAENEMDKCIHGTRGMGESHAACKYSESTIREIADAARKHSRADVAKMFGVKYSLVRDVDSGRRWRHLNLR